MKADEELDDTCCETSRRSLRASITHAEPLRPGRHPFGAIEPPHLLRTVPMTTYRRGVEYAHKGRVSVTSQESLRLTAVVQGTYQYRVEIDRETGRWSHSCDCPFAKTRATCKHIVATVVALAGPPWVIPLQRLLTGNPRSRLLELVFDRAAASDDFLGELRLDGFLRYGAAEDSRCDCPKAAAT